MTNRRGRNGLLFMICLVAIGAAYVYFAFLPGRKRIEAAREHLSDLRMFVAQDAELKKSIARIDTSLAETAKYVDRWNGNAARPNQISLLFGEISSRAKSAGATLASFEPQSIIDYASVRKVPLSMTVQGSFTQLHQMLRNFEELPETIWVEGLKVEGTGVGEKPLKAEVNLAVFVANPDVSD